MAAPIQFLRVRGRWIANVKWDTMHILVSNVERKWGITDYPISAVSVQDKNVPDVYWACRGRDLRTTLPGNWTGLCARVMIKTPMTIISVAQDEVGRKNDKRKKRKVGPAGSLDSWVYIDSIGVPRGVPDKYKARDQTGAGFESVLRWWCTINKNVDWINYIYYNQQRFVNYSTDALEGLSKQLAATSNMACQNRIALDYLLAKEGGVCHMFGDACCTFIPKQHRS